MSVNVAHTNPHTLSHTQKPPSPSSSSIPTSRSRDRLLIYQGIRHSDSAIYGKSLRLSRSQSCINNSKQQKVNPLRRSCSASYSDPFEDQSFDEFDKKLSLSMGFDTKLLNEVPERKSTMQFGVSNMELLEPSFLGIKPEPPEWTERDEIIRDIIARRANSIEIPLSLRMIKLKRLQQCPPDGDRQIDRQLNSSDKAFAAAIYIIKEIQSQALYLRGKVLNEDLEPIVEKVQHEMNSSFIWLFREVFSRTPDLMMDTMVLLADYATNSLAKQIPEIEATAKLLASLEMDDLKLTKQDTLGSSVREVSYPVVVPGESDRVIPSEVQKDMSEEEVFLWKEIIDEADRMRAERNELIDIQTKLKFIAPVKVGMEADDYVEYDRTHLLYQIALSEEPENPLLLSNYAQFLYLVIRDYDRAEECFQRALQLDSKDAELLSMYANFLWIVRKDLWAAEERFLQAVAVAPGNAYHTSIYASFLWTTGSEDTCYALDTSGNKQ